MPAQPEPQPRASARGRYLQGGRCHRIARCGRSGSPRTAAAAAAETAAARGPAPPAGPAGTALRGGAAAPPSARGEPTYQ